MPQRSILILLFLALPAPALAIWSPSGEEYKLDLGGSLRSIATGLQNYDNPLIFGPDNDADGLSQTLLRLTFSGNVTKWFSFEVHGLQGFTFATTPFTAFGSVEQTAVRFRAFDVTWNWADEGDVMASLSLDRLNVKLSVPHVDLTVGRQAINFSKAYFWNPLDLFLPFDPQAFDRDYKPGIDAARIDIALGAFSGINIVAVAGRTLTLDPLTQQVTAGDEGVSADWFGSALVARYFTNLWEWDLAFQAGKTYGGYHLGLGFSGEVLTLGVRGEGVYFFAMESDPLLLPTGESFRLVEDHGSAVIGVDRRFENSLYLALEYFYNGEGGDDKELLEASARLAIGEVPSLSEHLLGFLISYEFIPILKGQLSWILSLSDLSMLLSPGLVYSISDEAEFLLGALIALGERPEGIVPQSEYGSYPNVFYGEFKFYF